MNDCESEALTPNQNRGPPRMERPPATVRGCWTKRTSLEKSLLLLLSISTILLVTLALLLANFVISTSQNHPDPILSGKSAPFTSDGESNPDPEDFKNIGPIEEGPIYVTTERSEPPSKQKETYSLRKSVPHQTKENSILFTSHEENEDEGSDLELSQRLDKSLRRKIAIAERKFAERYPRDHAGSALKQLSQFLPRPLTLVRDGGNLTDREKISEIIFSLDLDGNGSASPWELHDWMLWVEKRVHQHVVEDQWASLDLGNNHSISWTEYHYKVHPYGLRDAKSKRRFSRERRRWRHADKDDDDRLSKSEFKRFLFPHLSDGASASDVIVHEAHEALDADYDGRVSQSEFVAVHRSNVQASEVSVDENERPEAVYFRSHLDGDQSGFLDVEEISQWVEPTGFIQAKSEVVYLMQHLDTDNDKEISSEEALAKSNLFLKSQVTFFGQLYELKNLRSEVFHLQTSSISPQQQV